MNRFLSFLIIFISAIFMMLEVNLFNKINKFYKDSEFRVFLSEESNVDLLRNIMKNYDGISEIIYISKDDAMLEFSNGFKNANYLLGSVAGNPFPASFKIVFNSHYYKNVDFMSKLSSTMLNLPGVINVSYSKKWLDTLSTISAYFKWLSIGCGSLLFCFLLFILIASINNYMMFYREEIKVVKDFGISNLKLKFRFGWKSLLWNILFAMISIGLIYCGYKFGVVQYSIGKDFITTFLPLLFMIGFIGVIVVLSFIILLVYKI